jgi:hypothetical protein
VTAEAEDAQAAPLQWSVIKSEDDFQQTHKVLRQKYGYLKDFQFRNPSTIGSNMFHLTNTVKPRREKKDEYLSLILALDPIPDEICAFLCLDNASLFVTKADGTTVLEGSQSGSSPVTQGVGALASAVAGSPYRQMQSPLATHLQPANYIVHTPWTVATPAYNISADHNDSPVTTNNNHPNTGSGKGKSKSGGNWRQNVALIASCLVMYTCAYFASAVVSKVGRVTGISQEDSIGTLITASSASM